MRRIMLGAALAAALSGTGSAGADCPAGLESLRWGETPKGASRLAWVYLSTTHERDFSEVEDAGTWPRLDVRARCAAWSQASAKASDMEAWLSGVQDLVEEAEASARRGGGKIPPSQLADFARLAGQRRERLGDAVMVAADAKASDLGRSELARLERLVERLQKAVVREPKTEEAARILAQARRPLADPFADSFELDAVEVSALDPNEVRADEAARAPYRDAGPVVQVVAFDANGVGEVPTKAVPEPRPSTKPRRDGVHGVASTPVCDEPFDVDSGVVGVEPCAP